MTCPSIRKNGSVDIPTSMCLSVERSGEALEYWWRKGQLAVSARDGRLLHPSELVRNCGRGGSNFFVGLRDISREICSTGVSDYFLSWNTYALGSPV